MISAGAFVLLLVIGAVVLFAITPSVGDAEARVARLAVEHGAVDNGTPVPAAFAEAIVASEDSRFYSDNGVDPIGLARAGWRTVTHGGDTGGSTISQQLAKLLYTSGQSSAADEIEQVVLAIKLNRVRPPGTPVARSVAAAVRPRAAGSDGQGLTRRRGRGRSGAARLASARAAQLPLTVALQ